METHAPFPLPAPSKRRYSLPRDRIWPCCGFVLKVIHMAYDYDLFVIGAGSGGVRAARIAAGHGARVGDLRGLPGRRHLRDPRLRAQEAPGLRLRVRARVRGRRGLRLDACARADAFDWATLRDKDKEIDRLNGVYIRLLEGAGVKLHMGRGRLMDRHTIEVGGRDASRPKDPGRDRRPARGAATARASNRHHLQRGVPSARPLPKRIADRRRRLHRRRVRRHLQRPGRPGRPGAAPRPRAARLRRGMPHRRASMR